MNETDFVEKGTDEWLRLRNLAQQLEHNPTGMSRAEVEEFLELYRKSSADLARARAETSNPELIESLNNVLGSAYSALYRKPPVGFKRTVHSVLLAGAQAVRRQIIFVVLSFVTFLAACLMASAVLQFRPDLRTYLIPSGYEQVFDQWKGAEFESRTSGENIMMSGFYASNNPRVAVTTAAIGASTLGIGSFYSLVQNGFLFGALSHEMASVGKLGFLYSSVAPHGATELSGMLICGAAGYSLGWAVIAPGRRRRLDSLREKGKDALVLLAMGVLMMYMAAPVEGFFSFNPSVPQPLKSAVGLAVFLAWCAYWAFYGRKEDVQVNEESETSWQVGTKPPSVKRSSTEVG